VVALDQDLLPTVPRPTLLGEAVDAFTAAASAAAVRFGLQTSDPWPLINVLSRRSLLVRRASP